MKAPLAPKTSMDRLPIRPRALQSYSQLKSQDPGAENDDVLSPTVQQLFPLPPPPDCCNSAWPAGVAAAGVDSNTGADALVVDVADGVRPVATAVTLTGALVGFAVQDRLNTMRMPSVGSASRGAITIHALWMKRAPCCCLVKLWLGAGRERY